MGGHYTWMNILLQTYRRLGKGKGELALVSLAKLINNELIFLGDVIYVLNIAPSLGTKYYFHYGNLIVVD